MRRCWLCRRPTPLAALVEAHLWPRSGNRPGCWLTADRVVWLCRRCAGHPSHPNPQGKEVIPLLEAVGVVGCVLAVLIVGSWSALSHPD